MTVSTEKVTVNMVTKRYMLFNRNYVIKYVLQENLNNKNMMFKKPVPVSWIVW